MTSLGSATALTEEQVARRRAVEALRSGVPSWDAVAMLGSGQPEAEDRFPACWSRSGRAGDGVVAEWARPGAAAVPPTGAARSVSREVAAGRRIRRREEPPAHPLRPSWPCQPEFVVSSVVISKETPLHDPVKTFRAAIDGCC